MADTVSMALGELVRKAEQQGDVDFLREGVRVLSQALMEVEVSQQLGAERYERSPERMGQRNGYREREWDTRVGTIGLRVPRVREGGYLPSWLEPRKRAEQALVATVRRAVGGRVVLAAVPARAGRARAAGRAAGQQRRPRGAQGGDRRRAPRGELAKVPGALPPQPPGPGAEVGRRDGRGHRADGLRPAGRRERAGAVAEGGRLAAGAVPAGGGAHGRGRGRRAGLHGLPARALAPDLEQQPARAAQQGGQAADRRGRDLPERPGRRPVGRGGPGRAARRVAGLPPLLQRRVAGQTEAGGADRADGAAGGELSRTACGEVDSAEGADAHLHRHYDDENHPKSRFTPLTGLIRRIPPG